MKVVLLLLVVTSLCESLQMSPVAIANAKIMQLLRDGLNPELRGGTGLKRSPSIVNVHDKEKTQYAVFPYFDSNEHDALLTDPGHDALLTDPGHDALLTDPGHDALLKDNTGVDTFEGQSSFFDESNMADNSAVWYTAGVLLGGSSAFL
jgi:hypothetical protein